MFETLSVVAPIILTHHLIASTSSEDYTRNAPIGFNQPMQLRPQALDQLIKDPSDTLIQILMNLGVSAAILHLEFPISSDLEGVRTIKPIFTHDKRVAT